MITEYRDVDEVNMGFMGDNERSGEERKQQEEEEGEEEVKEGGEENSTVKKSSFDSALSHDL